MTEYTKKQYKELLAEYYASVEDMNDAIENDEISDAVHEIADNLIDIYYHDIYKSCSKVADYVSQAQEEGLLEGVTELYKMIQIGQYYYYIEQLNEAREELEEELEELED